MTVPVEEGPRFLLRVPGLHGPPIGGGCCAVSREEVVLAELDSWPGLRTLDLNPHAATVAVLVAPGSDNLPAALEALTDRGLPATLHPQPD